MSCIRDSFRVASFVLILTCTSSRADEQPVPALPAAAVWVMQYDDKLDGEVKAKPGTDVRWRIAARNGRLSGNLADLKPGDPKDHLWSGEVSAGKTAIVSIRQDGPAGLICFYGGRLVEADRIVGTWYDNRGGSGDFELRVEKK